jgi:hypothetical protein
MHFIVKRADIKEAKGKRGSSGKGMTLGSWNLTEDGMSRESPKVVVKSSVSSAPAKDKDGLSIAAGVRAVA